MAGQFIQAFHKTFKANADMANPYRIVTLSAGQNEVELANAATDELLGVIAHKADAGKAVKVHVLGSFLVEAGAAITKGARVTSDSSGRAVAASTGNMVLGRAQQAATAAGELVEVFFTPGAVKA
jgi:hypothetical protein